MPVSTRWSALHRSATPFAAALVLLVIAGSARAEPAAGYFVDCESGDDAASGTSPQQPWKTLRKVNTTVTAEGSDVFLKAGTTCRNQVLTVDWNGSQSDRVIIGSYRASGSTAQQGYEGSSRPTIRGTYASGCRAATPSTCPVGMNDNDKNATPANQWDGLITIRTSYVTVQDIALADSSGSGLVHNSDNTASNVIVQNMSITQTFNAGIRLQGVKHDVLRDNVVDLVSLKKVDGRASNWSPGILVQDSAPAYVLIEGNKLSNSGGEGIGVLRSSHTIVRGNTVSNNRRPLIYLDNASDNVAENNMLLGNGYMNGADDSYGIGLSIAVEPYNRGMRNSVQNVFRNNLMANTRGCFNLEVFRDSKYNCGGGQCADPAAKGYKVGAQIYGNTCLQEKGRYIASANLDVNDNIDKIEIVDNVFSAKAGANCTLPTVPSPLLELDSNVFGTAPSDADCRGTNVQVGAAEIPLEVAAVHAGNIPSPDKFRPAPSSIVRRAGQSGERGRPEDRAEIDLSRFPASMREFSWPTCRPAPSEWAKALSYDYECRSRDDAKSVGGLN
jgi:parallel beta-helix repeat protein